MAKNKLSAPIQREIDRQKTIQTLCSSGEFGTFFSARFRDQRDREEEEKKWKEDIMELKAILEEYRKIHEDTATHSLEI